MNKLKIPLLEIPAFAAANKQAAAEIAILRSIIEASQVSRADGSKMHESALRKPTSKARTRT